MASSELAAFGAKIEKITSPAALGRVVMAGGMAGKTAALEAAAADLGGDRSFSGMRRKAPLGAGFDRTGATEVTLNFRPSGLWRLASQGRTSSGAIKPRRRGGKRALAGNGFGPVAASRYGRSRGLNTFDDAVKKAQTTVPKASFRQFVVEVGSVM
jgi:hypothetical protein